MRFHTLKLVSCCLLFAGTALAGTAVTFEGRGECAPEAESFKIDGSRFRSDSRLQGQRISGLYDGVDRLMTSLMHDAHQYMQVEVDEDALDYQGDVADSTGHFMDKQMAKAQAQMAAQCKQMRKQGMDCPQMDLRGMMQGMMASHMPAWRDLGRDGESGGIACGWWAREQGGRRIKEECSAKISALPIAERDRRGFEKGLKVMNQYAGNMQGMMKSVVGDTPQSGLPKDGLVIEQVCFGPGGEESGRVTAKFAEEEFDPVIFEIPSGYSQMSMTGAELSR